jgi:hypothetical protein
MTPPPMASAPRRSGGPSSPVPEGRSCGSAPRSAAGAWGDNPVSRCRSCSDAKGPGTSVCVFPMVLPLSGEGPRRPRHVAKGPCGTPWNPRVSSPGGCSAGRETAHSKQSTASQYISEWSAQPWSQSSRRPPCRRLTAPENRSPEDICSEKGVRLAQNMQVGPCIHVGIQL